MYVKVILNLRPLDCATCQNVLYVARYPVTIRTVSTFTQLPQADCGVLPQAAPATISAVCNSSKYISAVTLQRPGGGQGSGVARLAESTLSVFPNPSATQAHLRFEVGQAGTTRLSIQDAVGREVAVLLDGYQTVGFQEEVINTGNWNAGMYYIRLQTPQGQIIKKLTIAH